MTRFRKKKKLVTILSLALLLFLLVSRPSFLSPVRMFFVDVLKLPVKISSVILKEVKSVFSYRKATKEKLNLQQETDALKQQVISLEEADQENKRLKELLSFKYKSGFTTVAARVIARDPSNWVPAITIDRGRRDAIAKDMPVITELGLVGKVSEVGLATSKVILINDSNLNVPAMVQRSRETGVLSGTILGSCRMRYLSSDSDLEANDKIITSGLSQIFPKGIFIGQISEIKNDPSGLMKLSLVKPAVDLSKIEEVLVIVK